MQRSCCQLLVHCYQKIILVVDHESSSSSSNKLSVKSKAREFDPFRFVFGGEEGDTSIHSRLGCICARLRFSLLIIMDGWVTVYLKQ